MRVSKELAKPKFKEGVSLNKYEGNVFMVNHESNSVTFEIENVSRTNRDKIIAIASKDMGEGRAMNRVLEIVGNKVELSEEQFEDLTGKYQLIIADKENNIIDVKKAVLVNTPLRAFLEDYVVPSNVKGTLKPYFNNDTTMYGDFRWRILNGVEAVNAFKVLRQERKDTDEWDESLDTIENVPSVFNVNEDGTFVSGEQGSTILGIHMQSEFADINKIQIVQFSVNDLLATIGNDKSVDSGEIDVMKELRDIRSERENEVEITSEK